VRLSLDINRLLARFLLTLLTYLFRYMRA